MASILRAGAAYFLTVFAAGFALAFIRLPLLVPRFGVRTAELMEMPVMLAVIAWAAWRLAKRHPDLGRRSRLLAGLFALTLLAVAELLVAWLLGPGSPVEYIASRDPVSGSLYLASLGIFAVAPALESRNVPLMLAGLATFLASAFHLVCIAGGPEWYLRMGAGEAMASMATQGHWYPTVVTMFIAAVLAIWGLYAWSGAGLIRRLPLLRTCLAAIAAVFLVRGLAFVTLQVYFPGNSMTFWYASSGICLGIGLLYAAGLRQSWARLTQGTGKRQ